jgi:hypothetical protein
MDPISLHQLIGQEIIAFVPCLNRTVWQKLKLINVEVGGLWVESKDFQEWALQNTNYKMTPKTAVLFLPFHQIVHVLSSVDVPYVSERVLK